MPMFKIQPAPHTDHITKDGTELTKLPYPIFADNKGNVVGGEEGGHWQGTVTRVIGFQKDLAVSQIDLSWGAAQKDLGQVVGMYLVTSNKDGDWDVHQTAVESIEKVVL